MSTVTCISRQLLKNLGDWQLKQTSRLCRLHRPQGAGSPIVMLGLEDTSESFGLPATADLMFALISNEELEELNQIAVKQLKNRYNDPTVNKRFIIGIDRAKMKLFDIEGAEQDFLADSNQSEEITPVFDKTDFGVDDLPWKM